MRWGSRAGKLVREVSAAENIISWPLMKRKIVSQLQSWLLRGKTLFGHSGNSNYPLEVNFLICIVGNNSGAVLPGVKDIISPPAAASGILTGLRSSLPGLARDLKYSSVSKMMVWRTLSRLQLLPQESQQVWDQVCQAWLEISNTVVYPKWCWVPMFVTLLNYCLMFYMCQYHCLFLDLSSWF